MPGPEISPARLSRDAVQDLRQLWLPAGVCIIGATSRLGRVGAGPAVSGGAAGHQLPALLRRTPLGQTDTPVDAGLNTFRSRARREPAAADVAD
jgi:hypothetical protein